MKVLKDILYKTRIVEVIGSTNIAVEHISMDSRSVRPFGLFVAVRGTISDGHNFIDQSIEKGAIAIICEAVPANINKDITYIQVQNASEALGYVSSNFYDNPSEEIKVIGITGTNGKTTTTTLLHKLFRNLGIKAGLLSTIENKVNDTIIPATHTTPDAVSLNGLLRSMVDAGCEYCFMEASSHAIHQHRVTGINFTGAVFTNISHDHLDYHKTFDEYIAAKKALFDHLPNHAFALINLDDRHGEIMVQNCKSNIRSYGLRTMTDYKARIIENTFTGLHLNIDNQDLYTRLIGGFNAYNVLAVYAVACEMGLDKLEVLTELSLLESIEGRFQYFKSDEEITAVIDYAHTPDALENVLKTIKDIRTGNEKVITVVGCGGDRDRTKRPIMAQIAADLSDKIILTSDNPRTENPDAIIQEMQKGLDPIGNRKAISISDRKEAIKLACSMAETGDILLIAGKGHEKYQEINGEKFPFDDYEIVAATLKMLQK